jgi:hypothetical protein
VVVSELEGIFFWLLISIWTGADMLVVARKLPE